MVKDSNQDIPGILQKPLHVTVSSIQIHALNVQLRDDILLNELHLEGGDLELDAKPEADADAQGNDTVGEANANGSSASGKTGSMRFTSGETLVRAVISEPNLNRMVANLRLPPEIPIRHIRVAVLSGKIRVTCDLAVFFSLPISLEATPKIQNGVKVSADWTGLNAGKLSLPGPLRDVMEQYLNKTLDLSTLPIPIYLTEIRCEPGRITILGKARLAYPLALAQTPTSRPAISPEPLPALEASNPDLL